MIELDLIYLILPKKFTKREREALFVAYSILQDSYAHNLMLKEKRNPSEGDKELNDYRRREFFDQFEEYPYTHEFPGPAIDQEMKLDKEVLIETRGRRFFQISHIKDIDPTWLKTKSFLNEPGELWIISENFNLSDFQKIVKLLPQGDLDAFWDLAVMVARHSNFIDLKGWASKWEKSFPQYIATDSQKEKISSLKKMKTNLSKIKAEMKLLKQKKKTPGNQDRLKQLSQKIKTLNNDIKRQWIRFLSSRFWEEFIKPLNHQIKWNLSIWHLE